MIEFTNEEDFIAAYEGDFGEEAQEAAEDYAQEHGLEVVDAEPTPDDPQEDDFDPDDLALVAADENPEAALDQQAGEIEAIEGRIGRTLTLKEQRWLAEQPVGTIEQFANQLATRGAPDRDKAMRDAMMAERVEEAQEQAQAERNAGKPPAEEPPLADEVDPWKETNEQRVARMAAAVDAARELQDSGRPEAVPVGLSADGQED